MKGHQPIGNSYQHCTSPALLREFIERVYANRKVVATRMNAGSSRSHCAIVLTLMTLDTRSRSFTQTSLSIVDLAVRRCPSASLASRLRVYAPAATDQYACIDASLCAVRCQVTLF